MADGILADGAPQSRSEADVSGWWLVSYLVLWAVVIALSLLVLALARQVGTLHLRLGPRGALELDEEGPPLGEAPEPADARDLAGRPATVGGPGRRQLILFVSPACPVCREVLPSLPVAARAGGLSAIAVSDGDQEATGPAYSHRPTDVPLVAGPEIARAYGIPGTPYAVVLDDSGVVRAKGTVNTLEQIEGLIDTARRRQTAPVP